ncbi:hypothetical protein D8Y22_05545 [Salinadaptatus halalkaliphilus]|uniref:Uncharacterized protein n=1 Tax=Salinadaptatus halalkaliphilus TaxID=2419781 RepID=A0A4S3TNG1_9EURY|nr:hypothetical protein [Salinadaptatus halalkaliphilus]THE65849.1 hypothetical protein D8Y22_05545 [Salinadaptatus halalkaliphilus]
MTENRNSTLDEEYRNGVYYDCHAGEFCRFIEGDGTICLVHPKTGDIYHEIDVADWGEMKNDFDPVPDKAIEAPTEFLEDAIEDLAYHHEPGIGFNFARQHTEIVESSSS